jgi:predicted nucleic acid-binding protein
MDWKQFIGKTVNVTMHENYGIVMDPKTDSAVYEIVFKSGTLVGVTNDGLLLESKKDAEQVKIFIFFSAMKCVEIFNF